MSMHNLPTHVVAIILLALSVIVLASCATPPPQIVRVEVTATSTVGPSPTPIPTWTPTPEPTPTPIPPALVEALVPEVVSPLEPLTVEAVFVPPAGVPADVSLSAMVMDPDAEVYATFELSERDGDRYWSPEPLTLPLEPLPGYWWLIVQAETTLSVAGEPTRFFEIAPVAYRNLTDTLPSEASLRVPVDFNEVVAVGDPTAGGRVWQYAGGEVALWWAPGPTEELLLNNAVVALEATYAADERVASAPQPLDVVETDWHGHTAFEFTEAWSGPTGGSAVAWVIQDPEDWLYILRVRALEGSDLPPLHRRVAETFIIAGD